MSFLQVLAKKIVCSKHLRISRGRMGKARPACDAAIKSVGEVQESVGAQAVHTTSTGSARTP
jgi:hypothetical protein